MCAWSHFKEGGVPNMDFIRGGVPPAINPHIHAWEFYLYPGQNKPDCKSRPISGLYKNLGLILVKVHEGFEGHIHLSYNVACMDISSFLQKNVFSTLVYSVL